MSTKVFSKGTVIEKTGLATLRFGADTLNCYDVNPRYLNVSIAIGKTDSMIHAGLVFSGHATDQIQCSWSGAKWKQVVVHMSSSGLKVHVCDSDSSVETELKTVMNFDAFNMIKIGTITDNNLNALCQVANTEIEKEMKIASPEGGTNCIVFAAKACKACGLDLSFLQNSDAIPRSLRQNPKHQRMLAAV